MSKPKYRSVVFVQRVVKSPIPIGTDEPLTVVRVAKNRILVERPDYRHDWHRPKHPGDVVSPDSGYAWLDVDDVVVSVHHDDTPRLFMGRLVKV